MSREGALVVISILDRFIEVRVPEIQEDWTQPEWLGFHHFSATSLGMLSRCPEQFRQRYVLHRKERPGSALVVGSAFHDALKLNYQQKVKSFEDMKLSDVVQYLQDEAWPNCVEADGGVEEIVWRDDDDSPTVAAFVELSENVFAAS